LNSSYLLFLDRAKVTVAEFAIINTQLPV